MARRLSTVLLATLAGTLPSLAAEGRSRLPAEAGPLVPIVEASPTLAPFQHVRFCLRYPEECKSDAAGIERIAMTAENWELLNRINRSVNAAITPVLKSRGTEPQEGWTIAPVTGDCNDYAVTKRHVLVENGMPTTALRLSVVKTASGIGHLVLVVATTKDDLVLDNLTEEIRPWQNTEYHWLKIQAASNARFWSEIKLPGLSLSRADRKLRVADR
jgi:predicted transglutaminase-like cysteine proteinase